MLVTATKLSGIYQIVNRINGKRYVGSAANLDSRLKKHRSRLSLGVHPNKFLQNAWNKYGENAFDFKVVGTCSREKLIQLEQEVMDHLRPEYNLCPTAGSSRGVKLSKEARANISAGLRGRPVSAETRAKIGAAGKGKFPSAETRIKIGAASRNRIVSAKTRELMSAARTGKVFSLETRAKMSATMHAWWQKRKEEK